MTQPIDGAAVSSIVASYEDIYQVSVKAVASQMALMTGISVSFVMKVDTVRSSSRFRLSLHSPSSVPDKRR
jgi:hypothetical protein